MMDHGAVPAFLGFLPGRGPGNSGRHDPAIMTVMPALMSAIIGRADVRCSAAHVTEPSAPGRSDSGRPGTRPEFPGNGTRKIDHGAILTHHAIIRVNSNRYHYRRNCVY